ncbi:MAG: methyltransferase domain-containing protein [Burkholderiales bacterium]|nr:methyltransferase domain-containing protein [Burkholderiales bacterium]
MCRAMPDFTNRNPAEPAFWDERFGAGFTPWDEARTPPALTRFVSVHGPALGRRVLVPGCGSGHEIAALAAAGFEVLALDFSAAAVAQARAHLPAALAARSLRQADYFTFEAALAEPAAQPPFDWIYERAFMPALPPARFADWAARTAALVRPGGLLAGLFIVGTTVPQPRSGPPFTTTRTELDTLLGAAFECIDAQALPPAEMLPVFQGRLTWLAWRRR